MAWGDVAYALLLILLGVVLCILGQVLYAAYDIVNYIHYALGLTWRQLWNSLLLKIRHWLGL